MAIAALIALLLVILIPAVAADLAVAGAGRRRDLRDRAGRALAGRHADASRYRDMLYGAVYVSQPRLPALAGVQGCCC